MNEFKTGNSVIQRKPRRRILLKVDLKMIADARGVSKKTVQRAVLAGKFNPAELVSIANYILRTEMITTMIG